MAVAACCVQFVRKTPAETCRWVLVSPLSGNLFTCPAGLVQIKRQRRSWSCVCPGSALTFDLLTVLQLKQHMLLWLLRLCFYPNLIICSIHTYYLPGCVSASDPLLSHYLHFSERGPALTRQSKQALMWVWCHAYGVTTLFRCCRSEGADPGARRRLRWFVGEFDT